ncbi:MAG: parallel beta-helix domain-containing protein [Candidatus Binatia bacterium]
MKSNAFALAIGAVASLALAPASFAASCPDRAAAAITAPSSETGKACQNALAKAAASFVKAQIKTDAGCFSKQTPGLCPNAKTTAKIQKAALKARDAVVKACTGNLGGLTSSYSAFTDPAQVASCTLSQNNVEGSLLAYAVSGTPLKLHTGPGLNKDRIKCVKALNGAGVKYALGALQTINKCIAGAIKDGTPGDLSAVCVGHYNAGAFVPPTDAKTAEKLAGLLAKSDASIDKACGTLTPFILESIGACPGSQTPGDLKTCVACETWDSTLDIVKAQYSETGTFVANGPGAIQAAVDASGPGAKLLIQSGTYAEDVTISKLCSGGPNDTDPCGVDGDCTPGSCASPHAGLQLIGCGGATNDRPFIDVPSTGGPYTNGVTGSAVDGLIFQSLNVGAWPENGMFVAGADGVTFRDIYSDALDVSKYAVFPIQSNNVLIEGSEVRHVIDAGIYVGQSTNIIVRYNRVIENVAGLEIENSANAEVYGNYAYANAGGILIFKLPGLPVQLSNGHAVHHNVSIANNRENIGSGTVGLIPDGTGMIVLSNDDSTFHHNQVQQNNSFGLALIDQEILNTLTVLGGGSPPFPTTSPDQKSTNNAVYQNDIDLTNALAPDSTAPNATPLAAPILYVINEEDPAPNYNFNCFDGGAVSPVADNHIDSTCP